MTDYSDEELVAQFKTGENPNYAFNLLVRKYQQRLYWHIRRLVVNHDDANDVLQNTLIKMYHHLGSFREDAQLYTWLYRIATNESINAINQIKKKKLVSIDDYNEQITSSINNEKEFSGNEIQRKLEHAIQQLPEKQRIVFNLKYFEEMKYEEMSQVLDTSVGALKASFHHAVKKIENYLTEH